jgi:hypothetical protein
MPPGKPWALTVSVPAIDRSPSAAPHAHKTADRPGIIPAEDGPASGLGPRHVQRSDKYGGGYFVNVEGLHHLHCLVSSSVSYILYPFPLPSPSGRISSGAWYHSKPDNLEESCEEVALLQRAVLQGPRHSCIPERRAYLEAPHQYVNSPLPSIHLANRP